MSRLNASSDKFHLDLRRERMARNLTQSQLADELQISHVMIGRYETDPLKKNHARPNASTMQKINAFFESTEPTSLLQQVSLDEIVKEIQVRGFQVQLTSINKIDS